MNLASTVVRISGLLFLLLSQTVLFAQSSADSLFEQKSSAPSPDSTSITLATPATKSTAVALILSAVLPGAGQAYTESYWKVPVFLGLGTYFVAQWISNNNRAKDYRLLYEQSVTAENPRGNSTYLSARDFYKRERDTFTWYFFIMYLANLADAYVDAALYDFNVSEDLTIRVIPEGSFLPTASAALRLQIRF